MQEDDHTDRNETASGSDMNQEIQQPAHPKKSWKEKLSQLDLTPDLSMNIGSLRWFRGLATISLLMVATLAFFPDFGPLHGANTTQLSNNEFDEARTQMIMPIAYGGDSGRKMAAADNVIALASSPERPTIDISATLGRGDSFARLLKRSGVSATDVRQATSLVSNVLPLGDIDAGTRINIILGERINKSQPRKLKSLAFRARFDLNLDMQRNNDILSVKRIPIKVDSTPLRIKGKVGDSLYRSARAAGAPAKSIQSFLKIISGHTKLSSLRKGDEFDIILDYKRSETGEVKAGKLLYAGIDRAGKSKLSLLNWSGANGPQWFEASGVGKSKGAMGRPVNARITSRYGMRRHPILRYKRMHSGVDFGARHGAPIFAVTDGSVKSAGRMGGCGKAVKLNHSGNLATRYCHMSRIAVRSGQRVKRGQIIGYVGSTGLSTGPHLHYELYRNGRAINPMSVKFSSRAQLSGKDLANFKARINSLKSIPVGAALTPIRPTKAIEEKPLREIEKLSQKIARKRKLG